MSKTYANAPENTSDTNKIDVFYKTNFCSMDLLDLKTFGPKTNEGYR